MTIADVKKSAQERMNKSIDTLKADLAKVRTGRDATENIPATDDHCQFHAQRRHFRDIGHHPVDRGAIDAVGVIAHQRFAGQFEKDAFVGWFGHVEAPENAVVRFGHAGIPAMVRQGTRTLLSDD